MQVVISLPRSRIYKKEETKRLNNPLNNFVESIYKDWLDGIDFSCDTDFQQEISKNMPSEDVDKWTGPIDTGWDISVSDTQ